jgi:hypothetical protein
MPRTLRVTALLSCVVNNLECQYIGPPVQIVRPSCAFQARNIQSNTGVENYLDLAKSGAFNAGLNLTKRLHDGRHHLLKANLLFVPQVQLTPHHDHRGLQLHSTQIKTSEKHIVQPMNPSTLSEPDSKV